MAAGVAGFLFAAPLFLSEQLLGLEQHPGVHSSARVTVPGALVAGVARVVFGRLEDLSGREGLVPGVLGDGAGVLPRLPGQEEDRSERSAFEWEEKVNLFSATH